MNDATAGMDLVRRLIRPEAVRPLVRGDRILTRAFGLAHRAAGRSGSGEAEIRPVQAVYVVDAVGVIRFAHRDPDVRRRPGPVDLLEAARRSASGVGRGGVR